MNRVIVESPWAGNRNQLEAYGRECIRDCVLRGESPIASHMLFTQTGILSDDIPEERALGIKAGHAWICVAEVMAVYCDYGVSCGMREGIAVAISIGLPIVYRRLK